MVTGLLLFFTAGFLAFFNGANDNFKGVATLYGSRTASYRTSLAWGTGITFLGSIAALFLAEKLIKNFSGKGLVPDAIVGHPEFLICVGLAAGLTVGLATVTGFPVSTTHSLVGALVGTGVMAAGWDVNFARLSAVFLLPLLTIPLIAMMGASLLYPILHRCRQGLGIGKETCLCTGSEIQPVVKQQDGSLALASSGRVLDVDDMEACREKYSDSILKIPAQSILNVLHFLSAGALSFARGLNDTPKIAALLVAAGGATAWAGNAWIGIGMAVGGLLGARKVAETLSKRITQMNDGQGFTANAVASTLVIGASAVGMPVSTTHVSCGSLFGLGAITGQARWKMIGQIASAWVITLPVAALLGASLYFAIHWII